MDLMLKPVRIATSKPARQTYLNTVLLMSTSTILLLVAAFAYVLFYINFIPQIGITRDVHLQFGGENPYAFITLDNALTAQQPYSVSLSLTLPRSPPNLRAGNFMLAVSLLSPTYKPGLLAPQAITTPPLSDPSTILSPKIPAESVLFTSRRSALLSYTPPLITISKQLFSLPLHIFGLKTRDSEIMQINMAESISFQRGWRNIPDSLYVEVQTQMPGQEIQIYDMKVVLHAKLEGLRWIMYNHWISSFVTFTAAFWGAEVLVAILTWLLLNSRSSGTVLGNGSLVKKEEGGDERAVAIKSEEGEVGTEEDDDLDLSDTPRSFPTYGRQAPLRYSSTRIKSEGEEGDSEPIEEIKREPGEADDESEEIVDLGGVERGGRSDSGIGTSFSEGGGGSGAGQSVRRKSRRG